MEYLNFSLDIIKNYVDINFPLKITDAAIIVSFCSAFIGGCFAIYKWRKDTAMKRAGYLNSLSERLRNDKIIREVFYWFEYDIIWYDDNFHNNNKSEKEHKVDKTLTFFSYICYLKYHNIISKKEFTFVAYEVTRTLQNKQVQDYLYNIYHFANSIDCPIPYYFLIEFALKNQLFPSDFTDPKACNKNKPHFQQRLVFPPRTQYKNET